MTAESPTHPFGECILTRHWDDGKLTVDRADPRVLVCVSFLNEIQEAGSPEVTLTGDVLTVNAANRKVIYRLGEYLPERNCYVAEWPD